MFNGRASHVWLTYTFLLLFEIRSQQIVNTMNTSSSGRSSDDLSRILSDYEKMSLSIFNCLSMVIGLIGNFLVLVVVCMDRHNSRTPSMIILASLAVSDILVIMTIQPLYVYSFFHSINEGSILHTITRTSRWTLLFTSVFHLVVVSMDRYLAICAPNFYLRKLKYSRLWCSIALIIAWCFTIAVAGCNLSSSMIPTVKKILHFLCIAVMTVLVLVHTRLFIVAKKHRRRIQKQQGIKELVALESGKEEGEPKPKNLNDQHYSKRICSTTHVELKAFITTSIVCGAFLLSWLPLLILPFVLRNVPTDEQKTVMHVFPFANTLALCNSAQNPFIYCFRIRAFRDTLKKLINHNVLQAVSLSLRNSNLG